MVERIVSAAQHTSQQVSGHTFKGTVRTLVLALGVAALGGCAIRENATKLDPVAADPEPDVTVAYRDYPPVSAVYENTSVIAWPTRAPFVTRPEATDTERLFAGPLIFVANVGVMPISVLRHPPFHHQVAYRTGGVEPTQTGAAPFDSVVPAGEGVIQPGLSPAVREAWSRPGEPPKPMGKMGFNAPPAYRYITDPEGAASDARKVPAAGPEIVPQPSSGPTPNSVPDGMPQMTPPEATPPEVAPAEPLPATRPSERRTSRRRERTSDVMPLPRPTDTTPLAPSVTITPIPTTQP